MSSQAEEGTPLLPLSSEVDHINPDDLSAAKKVCILSAYLLLGTNLRLNSETPHFWPFSRSFFVLSGFDDRRDLYSHHFLRAKAL